MYKSIICLKETFNDLIPPPTGVVSGPFILTTYSLSASIVSFGSQVSLSYFLVAFSPQYTSIHSIFFLPPYAILTALLTTFIIGGVISTPIPSPSIKGITGLSGTSNLPSL